jgi:hypothetical protein
MLRRSLAPLAALDAPRDPGGVCLELSGVDRRTFDSWFVNSVVRIRHTGTDRDWLAVASDGLQAGRQTIRTPVRVVGVSVEGDLLWSMDAQGTEMQRRIGPEAVDSTGPTPRKVGVGAHVIGANCAVRIGGHWWLVDPLDGSVLGTYETRWLPSLPWVGVTGDGAGRLLLASADQRIAVLRPATREVEGIFPAPVSESYKQFSFGACAPIEVIDGYIGSFQMNRAYLTLLTMTGKKVATVHLADAVSGILTGYGITAADASTTELVLTNSLPPQARVFTPTVSPATGGCDKGVRLVPSARAGS